MILKKFKVSGHSMEPYLSPGNHVLVLSFLKIKKGDVVVFKHNSKSVIKRIVRIDENEFFVEGDNKQDSLAIGKVSKHDIIGKVVFKF